MLTGLVVIHVIVCLFVIGIVLLQASQQANIGSMFGGGASQTVFGSGTQTMLGKLTTAGAIAFFATCILISFVVEKDRSVIKRSEMILQEQVQGQVAPKEPATAGSPEGSAIPGVPSAPQAAPPEAQ